ncbi:hypothetical protein B566_EDAN017480 [Ephemera danica]|nr:hypothetical protein B566_EDAN017480 [Ephemera danica]
MMKSNATQLVGLKNAAFALPCQRMQYTMNLDIRIDFLDTKSISYKDTLERKLIEKILTRCKSSCREVNAICSISMSVWRYRSAETPCTEYESQNEGVREEDGLTFKLGEGNQFSFSCPTGKLLDSSEVVQCLAGNLTANFPACKYADEVEFHNSFVHEAPVASTMETEVTTLTSEVTDLGDTPPSKQPMIQLGTLDYILVAVILAFIFILIGLWTWIIKDKRREATRKRLLSVKQATAKHYVL